jgi:hypothetical protein
VCSSTSTFVSTLSFLFCPLFVGSFFGCERVSCSVAFYSLQLLKKEDNGCNGINLQQQLTWNFCSYHSQISRIYLTISPFNKLLIFFGSVPFLVGFKFSIFFQLGCWKFQKEQILASGFCLFDAHCWIVSYWKRKVEVLFQECVLLFWESDSKDCFFYFYFLFLFGLDKVIRT